LLAERVIETGVALHISDLAVLGYTVVPRALVRPEVAELRAVATDLLESDAAVDDPCGRRVWNLLRRDPRFVRVLADDRIDVLLDYLVGTSRLLSSMHVNSISAGATAQAIHTDVPFVMPPLPSPPLLANTIWCLDDWSAGLGATEVVPGSHLAQTHPQGEPAADEVVPIECESGSVIVTNGNLWHRSGPSDSRRPGVISRIAVLALYCRNHLARQEDYSDLPSSDIGAAIARIDPVVPYPFDSNGPDERFLNAQKLATSPFL
jgi:ectoine hydroxylase-related dioxygenase (phytanoyl-CoA dioxygenase family)